jgi:hypothetical protein
VQTNIPYGRHMSDKRDVYMIVVYYMMNAFKYDWIAFTTAATRTALEIVTLLVLM